MVFRSDEFEGKEVKGQGHQGQKRHFSALAAACMKFMYGKISLAAFMYGKISLAALAACAATPSFNVRSPGLSVAGPTAWNSLPDYLRDPTCSVDSFRRDLKTFLFSFY